MTGFQNQSSRVNPSTLLNSFMLWVTNMAFTHKAVPAMRLSRGPIGVPCFSSSALILAEAFPAFESKGNMVIYETNDSSCLFRFWGLLDLAIPTSSSYSVIVEIAISLGDFEKRISATLPKPLKKYICNYKCYRGELSRVNARNRPYTVPSHFASTSVMALWRENMVLRLSHTTSAARVTNPQVS